jgi:hypothetical protein
MRVDSWLSAALLSSAEIVARATPLAAARVAWSSFRKALAALSWAFVALIFFVDTAIPL